MTRPEAVTSPRKTCVRALLAAEWALLWEGRSDAAPGAGEGLGGGDRGVVIT